MPLGPSPTPNPPIPPRPTSPPTRPGATRADRHGWPPRPTALNNPSHYTRETYPDASATTLRTRRTRPSRPPPRPSRPTPSKPHLNNLPPRTLRGGRHGADDDHDGRTDGRTGPARTRPGLAGCKEPGCKEPCQPLGRVGRRLASPRSRPKLVRPARPMRLGWARFIPSGARPGQEMVPWEDRSAPHSTMLPSEPRNHAETSGRIRSADPNDPPRAPEPGTSGVRAPVDAADPADANPAAGPAAGRGRPCAYSSSAMASRSRAPLSDAMMSSTHRTARRRTSILVEERRSGVSGAQCEATKSILAVVS